MRFRFAILGLMVFSLVVARASAQDDSPSLGDLARNLRKNKATQQENQAPARTVIDNDNLNQVMEDARKARPVKADQAVFSIDPSTNNIK
ncbi:MAG: hypothetical protein WAK29_15900, partial [Terriglobales bacterium]